MKRCRTDGVNRDGGLPGCRKGAKATSGSRKNFRGTVPPGAASAQDAAPRLARGFS